MSLLDPPALSPTAAAARYARLRPTAFSGLVESVYSGLSTGMQLIGDSTGNETTEWAYLFCDYLSGLNSALTFDHVPFDQTAQAMPQPTRIRTGAAGERYVQISSTGCSLSAPGTNYITGDIDVRANAAADNWGVVQTIGALFGAAGNRSWRFTITASGKLNLQTSPDGTTLIDHVSTANPTVTNGQPVWVRAALDVDNGSAGHTVTYYQSTDQSTWTQVGTPVVTGGTTSLFSPTGGLAYEIGARQNTLEPFLGKIYKIEIRDGIDGAKTVAPIRAGLWQPYNRTYVTTGGAPVFTLVNGSIPGADQVYLSDAARLPKLTPDYGQALTVFSCSHNDNQYLDATYLAARDSWLTAVKARLPLSAFALVTQNPRLAPANYLTEHNIRRTRLMQWASRTNVYAVDTYRAFLDDSRGLPALINGDGIHPNSDGSQLWYQTVRAHALQGH